MQRTPNFLSKEVALNIERLEEIQPVFHALSTELRLKIIRCIAWNSKSVNELARELDMPVSTVALNVQVLEKAGLIVCDTQPGVRGTLKLCSRRIDRIMIDLVPEEQPEVQRREFSMPVGGFIRVGDVAPTCGGGPVRHGRYARGILFAEPVQSVADVDARGLRRIRVSEAEREKT